MRCGAGNAHRDAPREPDSFKKYTSGSSPLPQLDAQGRAQVDDVRPDESPGADTAPAMHQPFNPPIHLYLPRRKNPGQSTVIGEEKYNGMSIFKQIKSILNKSDVATTSADVAKAGPMKRRRRKRLTHKGRRILIIDDSATIVASLGEYSRSAGCHTSEAADAETGIELTAPGKTGSRLP